MRVIRKVMGSLLIFFDKTFTPKPKIRAHDAQARVNVAAKALALYQFETCPFCVKVRRAAKRLNIPLEMRDILKDKNFEVELLKGGGQRQVPCLRIEESPGNVKWMYESGDIVTYLESRFP